MPTDTLEEKINKLVTDVEVIKTQMEAMVKQNELISTYQEKRYLANEDKVNELDKRLLFIESKYTKIYGIVIGASAVLSLLFTILTKIIIH